MKADLHVHTVFSDGKCSPELMVETAEMRHLDLLAITDHGPALHVGMREDQIPKYLSEMGRLKENSGLKLLVGMEANIVNESGGIDVDEELRGKLDILIVGIHRLPVVSEPREMAILYLNSLINAIRRNRIDVVAHPFQFQGDLSKYLTVEEIENLLNAAAERETAIEVNEKYKAPDENFYRLCLKHGIRLSVGSDSHRAESVGKLDWVSSILQKIGASESDLIFHRFLR